jgi:peptidoglycan/xylan/chitin deacetylase (PgdA/CDA1 family)
MRLASAVRATARRARLAARPALALAACLPLLVVAEPASREIAITFDDLPVVAKVEAWHEKITADLLAALVKHRVPAIGFVNERKLERDGTVDPRRVALLERWLAAGLELGNHGYAHLDLHAVPLADAENDVLRGEEVTRRLLAASGRVPRWYRHPFLHTGRDAATRASFEAFLAEHGYRVAPVTVDNADYVFASAYEGALKAGDAVTAKRISTEYDGYIERYVAFYEQQSTALLGREIRQVLLLHASALNAAAFDVIAEKLEARGYKFVTLDRALEDPAYAAQKDEYFGSGGITWLHRWALTAGKRGAFFAGEPEVPKWVQQAAPTD